MIFPKTVQQYTVQVLCFSVCCTIFHFFKFYCYWVYFWSKSLFLHKQFHFEVLDFKLLIAPIPLHKHCLRIASACCKHPLVMWSLLNECNTGLYLQWFHWYLPVFDSKYSGILCMADVKAKLACAHKLCVTSESVFTTENNSLPWGLGVREEVLYFCNNTTAFTDLQLFNLKSCGVYHKTYTNSGI